MQRADFREHERDVGCRAHRAALEVHLGRRQAGGRVEGAEEPPAQVDGPLEQELLDRGLVHELPPEKQPEDDVYTRSSGAAPYAITPPLQVGDVVWSTVRFTMVNAKSRFTRVVPMRSRGVLCGRLSADGRLGA